MDNKKKLDILRWLNVIGFLGTLIINILANALPLNGKNTGDLSDSYPNLFVPAGLTFAIWGLIYLLLGLFAIFQAKMGDEFVEKIGVFFFISSIANILWIFMWHYEIVLVSLLMMLMILVCLLMIYLRLEIGKKSDLSRKEKWIFFIPFSIYLGWITVATIANVTAVAVDLNWNRWGFSEQFWTVLVIIVAVIITGLMLIIRKDIAYSGVVAWAILGIYLKRIDPVQTAEPIIANTALISLIIILVGIILTLIRQRQK